MLLKFGGPFIVPEPFSFFISVFRSLLHVRDQPIPQLQQSLVKEFPDFEPTEALLTDLVLVSSGFSML